MEAQSFAAIVHGLIICLFIIHFADYYETVLLFFVSGLPLAEKPTAKRYYLLSHGSNAVESGANPWGAYKVCPWFYATG